MAEKFEKPENLDDLSIEELRAANEKAIAAGRAIAEKPDMTDEDMAEAEDIMLASDEIEKAIAAREAADTERAERQARLKAAFEKPAEGGDDDDADGGDNDGDGDGDSDADAEAQRREAVTASAVARAKRLAPKPQAPAPVDVEDDTPTFSIVASANVPGFASNENLGTI